MKRLFHYIGMLVGTALLLTGCQTDADMTTMRRQGDCVLTATATEADITLENYQTPVLQLVWTMPEWYSNNQDRKAVGQLTKSIIQVATDETFDTYVEVETNGLSKTFTAGNLNALTKSLKLKVGQKATLYFRIQCLAGGNIDVYSNPCSISITPIYIEMKQMEVLDKDKMNIIGHLSSPEENGIYTGYMKASAWLNCWFQESDGNIWGNEPQDGHAFQLSNDATAWNCWFADAKGVSNHWFVQVDVNKKEWTATNIFQLKVNDIELDFNTENGQWQKVIDLTGVSELTFTATAKQFDKETTDVPETDRKINVNFGAEDGKLIRNGSSKVVVSGSGNHTIKVNIDDKGNYIYTIEEGITIPVEEVFPLPAELKVYNQEKTTVLTTLTHKADGLYEGDMNVTDGWMSFWIVDEENNITYGCPPDNARANEISKADDHWNFWIPSETTGVYKIEANLKTKKWTATWTADLPNPGPTQPTKLELYGDPNWNTPTATLVKTSDGIYEAEVIISADGNFKVVEGSTWYGCDPSDNSKLSSAEGNWNIWLTAGTYNFRVDWNNMTWSATPK